MNTPVDTHRDLHSEQGAGRGEHPGRSRNPVIKVRDLAWLEFEKPDLVKAEAFARAFGFSTVLHTADELHLRGTDAGSPCVIIRRGPRSRFAGPAFAAQDEADVNRLATATGAHTRALPDAIGGVAVDLTDPNGVPVRVVAGTHALAELPGQQTHTFNFGHELRRTNDTQRPRREPARVQRLGHVVVQTTKYLASLDWYLHHFGLIVSDFQYHAGQRDRGPVLSFMRCDRGATPADHHPLAARRRLAAHEEVLALDPSRFTPESARIPRRLGAWRRGWAHTCTAASSSNGSAIWSCRRTIWRRWRTAARASKRPCGVSGCQWSGLRRPTSSAGS